MCNARAVTSSTVIAEIANSASVSIFARRVSGIASVGLNAMAFAANILALTALIASLLATQEKNGSKLLLKGQRSGART
jgi:hypothetical protein